MNSGARCFHWLGIIRVGARTRMRARLSLSLSLSVCVCVCVCVVASIVFAQ